MSTALILKSDRLMADALRQIVQRTLPGSAVRLAMSVSEARLICGSEPIALLVTGLEPQLESDVLELLAGEESALNHTRIVVVTAHDGARVLTALHGLSVHGVFDTATEDLAAFERILADIMFGGRYWSRSAWDQVCHYRVAKDSLERTLSSTEQIVLAVLGDGSDDNEAAERLGMMASTVATVRRNLHRKLRVRHRGELVRVAAQHGFVRFTQQGVVRPGFSLLVAANQTQKRKCPAA
jgi:DNA-binding NarL/FixJ family response regulator